MSNINNLVLLENNKLPTVGDVGAGYGKTIGSMVAGLPGHVAGYYIGKSMPSDPNHEMNPKKRLHRYGAMLHNSSKVKNIAITALGAGVGALLGGAGHHAVAGKRPKLIGKGNYDAHHIASAGGGAALGAALAHHLFGAGRENRHLAKKLGYGRFGRTMASFAPETGLFHPHKQTEEFVNSK